VGDGAELLLELSLADGRSAIRRVRTAAALRLTLEALLTMPPAANDTASATPAPLLVAAPPPQPSEPIPSAPKPAHAPFAVELGLAAEARLEHGPTYSYVGVTSYVAVPVESWRFSLSLRWDPVQLVHISGYPDFDAQQVAFGVLLARRLLDRPAVALDLGAGAMIVYESQSIQPPGESKDADSTTEPKLAGLARLQLGRASVRTVIALDGELSPARLGRPSRIAPDLPPLPAFSVALAVGASWRGR
jgi:hypothetical protein